MRSTLGIVQVGLRTKVAQKEFGPLRVVACQICSFSYIISIDTCLSPSERPNRTGPYFLQDAFRKLRGRTIPTGTPAAVTCLKNGKNYHLLYFDFRHAQSSCHFFLRITIGSCEVGQFPFPFLILFSVSAPMDPI